MGSKVAALVAHVHWPNQLLALKPCSAPCSNLAHPCMLVDKPLLDLDCGMHIPPRAYRAARDRRYDHLLLYGDFNRLVKTDTRARR